MTKRINLKSIQIKELEVKRKDEKINILNEKIAFMKKQVKQLQKFRKIDILKERVNQELNNKNDIDENEEIDE